MFYKLSFDIEKIDKSIQDGTNTIYAETTNIDEIEYANVKKGFFDNIILSPCSVENWPNVEFYYSSIVSDSESDYLLNIKRWPLIHIRVMEEFDKNGITGLQYFPIKLIDTVTRKVNNNYVLMFITEFIDAFDMAKSRYKYNEKYDFYTFIPEQTYLNEVVCSDYDIFRCSKSVASIYVSEKIKRMADDNHWTGFTFYEQK